MFSHTFKIQFPFLRNKTSCSKEKKIRKLGVTFKQGRKRPLDTLKRMIERRERERKVEGEI